MPQGQASTFLHRCIGIGLLLFFAFGAGWLFGSIGKDLAIALATDERDDHLTRIEALQDPIELELIRKLEVGDDLAKLPQLAMLIDEIIQPVDDDFTKLYDYLRTTEPFFLNKLSDLPKDPADCEVLVFDLKTIEHEGAKSFFVVTQGTIVLAVIVGEYWLA